jgi:ubiquinone/menaquinone biosynthesis C-methylase UbiE
MLRLNKNISPIPSFWRILARDHWDTIAFEAEKDEIATRREDWQRTARNWVANYTENKAYDFIAEVIQNHVKLERGAKILDVGCGPGKWVRFFANKGFEVTGIDFSPLMIRLAEGRIKNKYEELVKFHVMDVTNLNLPSNFYDLVNCVTVLQHILNDKDQTKAVQEMVRVTKPSGHILIYEAAPIFILKKRTPCLRFRTMKEYISMFEEAGAHLTHWRAADLSFPITFLFLRRYSFSFSRKVYYYSAGEHPLFPPNLRSFLSRIVATTARPIDYKIAKTPLGLLSIHKILLFRKTKSS